MFSLHLIVLQRKSFVISVMMIFNIIIKFYIHVKFPETCPYIERGCIEETYSTDFFFF